VLAVSLDGRLAPPAGGAAQLGGKGDRRVLEEALTWSDAVLIGAETLRLHQSSCQIHAPDLLRQRQEREQPLQPIVVVWSRSGMFSPRLPFFQQPLERWLLLSSTVQPPSAMVGFDRVLPFLDWPKSLQELGSLGVERIAVLGGARLAGSLVAARALDALQLTLCPMVLGGAHSWLPPAVEGDPSTHWVLRRQEPLPGGELLLSYERQTRQRDGDDHGGPGG
jgi:5-amino-6-(5-phosphoribosylamino)uracil reductase